MTNHVVTPGIAATLKAMMRRPELFGISKPAPRYALNVDDIWRISNYLNDNGTGGPYGRAFLFLHYGWDVGVRD